MLLQDTYLFTMDDDNIGSDSDSLMTESESSVEGEHNVSTILLFDHAWWLVTEHMYVHPNNFYIGTVIFRVSCLLLVAM